MSPSWRLLVAVAEVKHLISKTMVRGKGKSWLVAAFEAMRQKALVRLFMVFSEVEVRQKCPLNPAKPRAP